MSNTHTAEPGMLPGKREKGKVSGEKKWRLWLLVCILIPVRWCGKETQDDISSLHVDDVACGMQKVKIKV